MSKDKLLNMLIKFYHVAAPQVSLSVQERRQFDDIGWELQQRAAGKSVVHLSATGESTWASCGLIVKQSSHDPRHVTCTRCKRTNEYHDLLHPNLTA